MIHWICRARRVPTFGAFAVAATFLLLQAILNAQTVSKPAPSKPAAAAPAAQGSALPILRQAVTGDFDVMVKRRIIRVLVPHSKTTYFVERGQPRGIAYEALKAFEDEINKKRG